MERAWAEIHRDRGDAPGMIGPDIDDPEYGPWWKTYSDLELTPNVWPRNKACLAHVIDKLRAVLPVSNVEIDPQLRVDEEPAD